MKPIPELTSLQRSLIFDALIVDLEVNQEYLKAVDDGFEDHDPDMVKKIHRDVAEQLKLIEIFRPEG